MGRRSLIISIGVIIFAIIFIVLFLLSRLTAPSDKSKKLQNAKEAQAAVKITGSINADFLPLISGRSDFVIDSQEYKLFYQLLRAQLEKILI